MADTVKIGWLHDKNGDKFAPKTLTSQVQTSDGVLLEDKLWKIVNNTDTSVTVTLADKTEYRFPNATTVNITAPTNLTEYECYIIIGGTNPTISLDSKLKLMGVDNASSLSDITRTEISIKDGAYIIGYIGS